MKNAFLIILLAICSFGTSQNTSVPDSNFEQALLNLGLDTGAINGMVPTNYIDTVTYLDIQSNNISDLTGIEDFASIETLSCGFNLLTSLSFTQNLLLKNLFCTNNGLASLDVSLNDSLLVLHCETNQLSTLDVTQNILLTDLYCTDNQLVNLNITQNINLVTLFCGMNSIPTLDVTQNNLLIGLYCSFNLLSYIDVTVNPNLVAFHCNDNQLIYLDVSLNNLLVNFNCSNNQLECLNMGNGNNPNFTFFNSLNNSNLGCIQVDSIQWAITNWTMVDDTLSYSDTCYASCSNPIGINEFDESLITIYPNPITTHLNINTDLELVEIELLDITGKLIQTYTPTLFLNLEKIPTGVYFLKLVGKQNSYFKKIIKQ